MIKLEKNIQLISAYLSSISFLNDGEKVISVEVPGAGNMNFTLRVKTDSRSLILKQSRPYVEKYPQVAAPEQRIHREAEFYQLIESHAELSNMTPTIYHKDLTNHILIMEDLGSSSDFSHLYAGGKISNEVLVQVVEFVKELHYRVTRSTAAFIIENHDMKQLNHMHMYVYPFLKDNGLNLDDITPGLASIASQLMEDQMLLDKIKLLGEEYLSEGPVLLHGDYFPGSWLTTDRGVYVIDPEFCFFGYPTFELGVMVAHLMMSRQDQSKIDLVFNTYGPIDKDKVMACAGLEILRRICGLAQLPLSLDLEEKRKLINQSIHLLKK